MGTTIDSLTNGEELSEGDIQSSNTAVGAAIGEILRTTLGPTGMDKMLVDSNGMVLLTNDGKTILGEMNINFDLLPAARLLADLAIKQDESIGDGITAAITLAGELLHNAEQLFDQGLHPATVAQGYALAVQHTESVISNTGIKAGLNESETVEQVVRTGIAGWGSDRDETVLASLLVEATDELATTGELHWDRLGVKKIVGGTVTDSSLQRGTLYKGDPVHTGMPQLLEPGRIVCLNTNLKPDQTTADQGDLAVRRPDDLDQLLQIESETVRSKVERIAESGANAVFSDKSIDDRAQQLFADRGILAVRRVSESDFQTIVRATGATVTDAKLVEPSDLGEATYIEYSSLGGDNMFTIATEDANQLSLVLRGGTRQVLNEMERAAENGFATLRALDQDPRIVPGGGAIEMKTSLAIRDYANRVDDRTQLAVRAFADALETIPRSLAENAGLDPIDTLVELRERHAAGNETIGVNAMERCLDDAFDAEIVDPLLVKQRMITAATDTILRIVRIDDVVDAERNGDLQ